MASIERTAYPRFKRIVSDRELHESFTPSPEEIAWACDNTRTPEHELALVVLLKGYQRLGYFPELTEVPVQAVEHIRGLAELGADVEMAHDSERTGNRHREVVRSRLNVTYDPEMSRQVAERAITEAVQTKDNPADLINVALEELVRARQEIPGYTTLDKMTARIRTEVNGGFHAQVYGRIDSARRQGLADLLDTNPVTGRSRYDDLKATAPSATLTHFREHLARLTWLDGLGSTDEWVTGVPPAKVAHFAAEARSTDAGDMRDIGEIKRIVLIACVLHLARVRGRDELATMFCKRMAVIHKQARERFEKRRDACRVQAERLVNVFGDVLSGVREAVGLSRGEEKTGPADDPIEQVWQRTGAVVLTTINEAGGVEALSRSREEVSAYHGDNYLPFLEHFYRRNRSALFDLLDVLELVPTSADHTVADAVEFLRGIRRRSGEFIPDHLDGRRVDLSFASEAWQRILREQRRPGRLVRRHFEACVFTYLAAEMRSGDIAVAGSESYANLYEQLLSWRECEPLVAGYCAEAGLPDSATQFRAALEQQLTRVAADVDAGYPDNADLVIDGSRPVLKRRRGTERPASALALEKTVLARLPERGLLDVIGRTAHLIGWHRHFGPISGSDPKIRDALARYVLMTFTYGANLGPYQVARHMSGISAHQIATAARHASPARIDAAKTDVVNAYAQLDLPKVWGEGHYAAADGMQVDTWADNLLAETSIRYGTGVRTGSRDLILAA